MQTPEATLLFLIKDSKVLLAMKKRGYGAGKWNGVGGKVQPGESLAQAVVRECQEEIGVTPYACEATGRLYVDRPDETGRPCRVTVFTATTWHGTPQESEEMRPKWFPLAQIPYRDMWATDQHWLPYALRQEWFSARLTKAPTLTHALPVKSNAV